MLVVKVLGNPTSNNHVLILLNFLHIGLLSHGPLGHHGLPRRIRTQPLHGSRSNLKQQSKRVSLADTLKPELTMLVQPPMSVIHLLILIQLCTLLLSLNPMILGIWILGLPRT